MSKKRTDEELREAATHVAHEIRMLASAWKRHGRDRHAYVGWFVHCRVLMEFFCLTERCPNYGDEVCAWHYFDRENVDGRRRWAAIRSRLYPPDDLDVDRFKDATDTLAAHLTFDRIATPEGPEIEKVDLQKTTPSAKMTEFLLGLARLFLRELPNDRLGWFGALNMV